MAISSGVEVGGAAGSRKRRAEQQQLNSFPKTPKVGKRTDFSRWRLHDDDSRHTWRYLEDDEEAEKWPQSNADKYFLNLPLVILPFTSPFNTDLGSRN